MNAGNVAFGAVRQENEAGLAITTDIHNWLLNVFETQLTFVLD